MVPGHIPCEAAGIRAIVVATIGHGRRVDALVAGILGLCQALELVTVAEGIEQKSQLDRLETLGCQVGQGYLFARPVPAAEFVAQLTTTHKLVRRRVSRVGLAGLVPLKPAAAAT